MKIVAIAGAAALMLHLVDGPIPSPRGQQMRQPVDSLTAVRIAIGFRQYALRDSLPVSICEVPRAFGKDSAVVFAALTPEELKVSILPCASPSTGRHLRVDAIRQLGARTFIDLTAFDSVTTSRSESYDYDNTLMRALATVGSRYAIRFSLADSDTVRFQQDPLLAFEYAIKLRRSLLGDSAAVNLCDLPRRLGVDSATVFATLTQERIGAEVRPCPSGPSGRPQLWAEQVWREPGLTRIVFVYSSGVAFRSEHFDFGSAVSFASFNARYSIGEPSMVD